MGGMTKVGSHDVVSAAARTLARELTRKRIAFIVWGVVKKIGVVNFSGCGGLEKPETSLHDTENTP